jgi:hypothetical protein
MLLLDQSVAPRERGGWSRQQRADPTAEAGVLPCVNYDNRPIVAHFIYLYYWDFEGILGAFQQAPPSRPLCPFSAEQRSHATGKAGKGRGPAANAFYTGGCAWSTTAGSCLPAFSGQACCLLIGTHGLHAAAAALSFRLPLGVPAVAHRLSMNFTGIDTHIATGCRPRRAGSKRHRPTASTAAWSRSGCPADCST